MEIRKQKEIEYYDREAEKPEPEIKEAGSLADFNPFLLSSYRYLYKLLKEKCKDKIVLDYGCGKGIHLVKLARVAREVVGIDLSEKSLEMAKKRIQKQGIKNAKVILMDAEKMEFEDNSFDVVFDGGTFSSLDLDKALPEIWRVLKPQAVLIGIETFGHNPLTNLKRKANVKSGKRTEWAAEHIVKTKDLEKISQYFNKKEIYYFHLISWFVFPFLNLPFGEILLKIGEWLDKVLMRIFPFLKRYSFKIVFIFYDKKII